MTRTITYSAQASKVSESDYRSLIGDLNAGDHGEATANWRKSDGEVHVTIQVRGVSTDQIEETISSLDSFVSGLPVSLPAAADNAQIPV